MRSRKLKKCFLVLTIGSALIPLTVGLDMAVSGSVYHPLTYIYNGLGWLLCKSTSSCNRTAPTASLAPASSKYGVVVTSQHKASEVGLQILKQGGNAIDAAVAVGYALACHRALLRQYWRGWVYANPPCSGQKHFYQFSGESTLSC
jgi:gamma-glutamyltranspeptidase/glutathione hydrolase